MRYARHRMHLEVEAERLARALELRPHVAPFSSTRKRLEELRRTLESEPEAVAAPYLAMIDKVERELVSLGAELLDVRGDLENLAKLSARLGR